MIINSNHCLSLRLSSWRRGQKVCTAHLLCGQRTKAGRGDGGCADAAVPLDMRQGCNVDHQTSFLCVKPLSYTQTHSKAVQRFLGPERTSMVFSWGTLKLASHGVPPNSLFQALWLANACFFFFFFNWKMKLWWQLLFFSFCAPGERWNSLWITCCWLLQSLPSVQQTYLLYCPGLSVWVTVKAHALGHNPLAGMRASPRHTSAHNCNPLPVAHLDVQHVQRVGATLRSCWGREGNQMGRIS